MLHPMYTFALRAALALLLAGCSESHSAVPDERPTGSSTGNELEPGASAGARAAVMRDGAVPAPGAPERDAGTPRGPLPGAPTGLPEVERTELDVAKRMLTRVGSWALPGVDDQPTEGISIACDGDAVWVFTAGSLLLRIHLASGEITRQLSPTVSSGGGINPSGIERVGDEIWISTAGNQNAIVMADAATGKTVRTASSPSELGPTDFALGDEGVWFSDGTGSLFLLDRETAAVLWEAQLTYPERDYGIAVRADQVVIGNLFGGIWLHSRDDLSVIAELVDEDGKRMPRERIGTMCFSGDRLLILNERGIEALAIE